MKEEIKSIINWNKIAGNNNLNRHLEISMLSEEFAETILAIKKGDKIEILDGVIDIFIVGVGTLYKHGFNEEQISEAFKRIMNNNYSKFQYDTEGNHICIKDELGKMIKPKGFVGVDLSDLIPNNK